MDIYMMILYVALIYVLLVTVRKFIAFCAAIVLFVKIKKLLNNVRAEDSENADEKIDNIIKKLESLSK